jgi:hypothetical protein
LIGEKHPDDWPQSLPRICRNFWFYKYQGMWRRCG